MTVQLFVDRLAVVCFFNIRVLFEVQCPRRPPFYNMYTIQRQHKRQETRDQNPNMLNLFAFQEFLFLRKKFDYF